MCGPGGAFLERIRSGILSQDANRGATVCFLLGLPRSGTTLLAHLLQQHPEITAPPEPWLCLLYTSFVGSVRCV
ncbi:sulfotransferase [Bradyrhizobium sp. UFLA06-06]